MTTLSQYPAPVEIDDTNAHDEADERWWSSQARSATADPPSEPLLPTAEWLRVRSSYYRSMPGAFGALLADEIDRLRESFEFHRTGSVARLLETPGSPFHGADLDAMAWPDRLSDLADVVDEQAAYFLHLGGDLARLVCWALLKLADRIEGHGSRTAEEYEDTLAAFEAAAVDAFAEDLDGDCETGWNPLF